MDTDKEKWKYICKYKGTQMAKLILNKKIERTNSDIDIHCVAIVIKACIDRKMSTLIRNTAAKPDKCIQLTFKNIFLWLFCLHVCLCTLKRLVPI